MNTIEILGPIITLIGMIELSLFTFYGGFVKEKDVKEYLDKRDGDFELNLVNKDIIISFHKPWDGTFINKHIPLSFLSKYYISGMGRVWRWSEGHRRIEKLFEELKNKKS